jgi:hypothetical protein
MVSELFAAVFPFLQDAAATLNAGQEALPQVPDPQLVEVPSPAPPTLGDAPLEEPRIGGESVSQIYLQLLCKYRGKGELPEMDLFWEKAESIFKSKRKPNPITDGGA